MNTGLNVGQLKKILNDLPDDAIVIARDRDCCALDQVHVIGSGKQKDKSDNSIVEYVDNPSDMYGGEMLEEEGVKQAIVFCGCD